MGDWEIEALNASIEGVNCDFWVHTCWGNYSGTPAYFPDETKTEFGAFVLDKRASDAPAPERAYAIFPHVLNANITALNYEVGRTGPDDLKPLADNNWIEAVRGGRDRRQVHRHRERGRGRRPDPAGARVRPGGPARAVHRLRADQPAADDRRRASCARSATGPPWYARSCRPSRETPLRGPGRARPGRARPEPGPPGSSGPRRGGCRRVEEIPEPRPARTAKLSWRRAYGATTPPEPEARRAGVSHVPEAASPVSEAAVPRDHSRARLRADAGRDPGLPRSRRRTWWTS